MKNPPLLTLEQVLVELTRLTDEALDKIHGKFSADYVLGYQRCAKDLKQAVFRAWTADEKPKL